MNRLMILALIPAASLANGVPVKPEPVTSSVSGAESIATANPSATSSSLSTQAQTASSSTTTSTINDISNGASSGGNIVSSVMSQPRQAPAVSTAPAPIVGCGASGSAGGSNTGGAAVLGLSWVTVQCYDFMLAQAYQAAGAYAASCEVLNRSKAGRRARKRGVELPTCAAPVIPPADTVRLIDTPPDLSSYVRKEELREVTDRITRQMVAK